MSYTNGYDVIADIYDKWNEEIDYPAWADFIEKNFDRYLKMRPALVLDLACGTGSMTAELAARGYDMIGVDGSAEMLSVAYERAVGQKILYLLQDMRAFELYGTVGAVTCCLDSINYLTGEGDLDACFACVHNYLDPDGLFLFDINSPYKFEHLYGDRSYIMEDTTQDGKRRFCAWQNDFDRESGLCDFYLTVFEETENGYSRRDEEQRERCYATDDIKEALLRCGFELLSVSGGYDFEPPTKTSERLYFAARCKKEKCDIEGLCHE